MPLDPSTETSANPCRLSMISMGPAALGHERTSLGAKPGTEPLASSVEPKRGVAGLVAS